jgi:hypothetical protein
MSKVPLHTVDPFEDHGWTDEYWDWISEIEASDWSNWDEHPWQWYIEKATWQKEGWILVILNPKHKNVTAIYWLKSQKAKFKTSNNEFLLKDGMCATLFILKFG